MDVLIVDDDCTVRAVLKTVISDWGFESWGVEHGRAALEYLSDEENPRPKMILLDGRMPVMGGEEFLRYREGDEKLRAIPVVVFSATAHEIKCASAQGYVSKPDVCLVRPFVEKFCSIAENQEGSQ